MKLLSAKTKQLISTLNDRKQPFRSAYYTETSTETNIPGFRSCSSQTEISTLLIRPDFSKIEPENDTQTKIAKYHGQFITDSHMLSMQNMWLDRLKQYREDLDTGKDITVFESDLSAELKAEFNTSSSVKIMTVEKSYIDQSTDTNDLSTGSQSSSVGDLGLIHKEIFAQLESKVKSTLHFEIDAAIKKSTESFKNLQVCDCLDKNQSQVIKQHLGEKQSTINELDHELILLKNENKRLQSTLSECNSTISVKNKNLKEKESEISILQKKVANQTNTIRQQLIAMDAKCKEMEKLKKSSSQQTSQVEVNKLKSKIRQVLNYFVYTSQMHQFKTF